MTVYAIAQLAIHDRARYQRYVAAFMPILAQYGGRLLAADEHPEVTACCDLVCCAAPAAPFRWRRPVRA